MVFDEVNQSCLARIGIELWLYTLEHEQFIPRLTHLAAMLHAHILASSGSKVVRADGIEGESSLEKRFPLKS